MLITFIQMTGSVVAVAAVGLWVAYQYKNRYQVKSKAQKYFALLNQIREASNLNDWRLASTKACFFINEFNCLESVDGQNLFSELRDRKTVIELTTWQEFANN